MLVGVDPGGQTTGIVLRDRDRLLHWCLVTRDGDLHDYLDEIVEAVDDLARPASGVAVEDLSDPTPQMGTISIRGLIDTAAVIGALMLPFDPLLVPPGGHGAAPLQVYPKGLVGVRELKGTGRLRHGRAAWDVAGYAATLLRVGV